MSELEQPKINGLVLRETDVGEHDKLITLLTDSTGKITISAKGVKSMKSKHLASTQQFAYSSFVLRKKGDYYYIVDSLLIKPFYRLREDIVKLALAYYLCAVAESATFEDMDDCGILRLTLNSLHALDADIATNEIIKAAFELKITSELGLEPDLSGCAVCGKTADRMVLDVMMGHLLCPECKAKADAADSHPEAEVDRMGVRRIYRTVDATAIDAMRYILASKQDKLLQFKVDNSLYLSAACETYLLNQLEKDTEFTSLKFYKSLL